MKLKNVVDFVRSSCLVQEKELATDPNFLELTDEEIILMLQVVGTKQNINISDDINDNDLYVLVLLCKREIYSRLAVLNAPKVFVKSGSDSISLDGRFNHFYRLIEQIDKEFQNYLETGTPIKVGEIYLESRYYTSRTYNSTQAPKIRLDIDKIFSDHILISWLIEYMRFKTKFVSYTLYYMKGNAPIYNEYENGIVEGATKIEFSDIHTNKYSINNLVPNTDYSICIFVEESNGLRGFDQKVVHTIDE